MDKLVGCQPGKEGSVFCPSLNQFVSPVEFESLGGRANGSNPLKRQAICHLLLFSLPNELISAERIPLSLLLTLRPTLLSHLLFISLQLTLFLPLLKHIACVVTLTLSKYLYLSILTLLNSAQLFSSLFTDLVSAFVKLDCDNSLPAILCESLDLHILCLEPDPVSKQLDLNTKSIPSLTSAVNELPATCSHSIVEQISNSLKTLQELLVSANVIKNELSTTVDTAVKNLSSKIPTVSSAKTIKPQPNRFSNLIFSFA